VINSAAVVRRAFARKERNLQLFLQSDLAKRWRMSPRTLEQWRWQGRGPRFLKIGGRVLYRLADVEAHESASIHINTIDPAEHDAAASLAVARTTRCGRRTSDP
jgi:hypothetical protein